MAIETVHADGLATGDPGEITGASNAYGTTTGTWTTNIDNDSWTARFTLDNTTDPPDATNSVDVLLRARKQDGNNNPSIDSVAILENGVQRGINSNIGDVSSLTGEDVSLTVSCTGMTGDGSNLEIEIVTTAAGGSPTNRAAVQLDYMDVDVNTSIPAQTITPGLAQQLVTSFSPSFFYDQIVTPGLHQQLVTSFSPSVYVPGFGTVLQSATSGTTTSDATTVTFGSAPNEGELIVLQWGASTQTNTPTLPTGFELVAENGGGDSTWHSLIALKVAGASEGTSYTITGNAGNEASMIGTVRNPGNGIEKWIVESGTAASPDVFPRYAESVDVANVASGVSLNTGIPLLAATPDGEAKVARLAQLWRLTTANETVTWSGTGANWTTEYGVANSASGKENRLDTVVEIEAAGGTNSAQASWTSLNKAALIAVVLVEKDSTQTSPDDSFTGSTGDTPSGTRWANQIVDPSIGPLLIRDNISINTNRLELTTGTVGNGYTNVQLDSVFADTDYEVQFLIDGNFNGTGNKYLYCLIGSDGTSVDDSSAEDGRPANSYYVRIKLDSTNVGAADNLYKRIGGTESTMDSGLNGGSNYSRNAAEPFYLKIKIENSGSNVIIGVKAWDEEGSEPGSYDEYTDTAPGVLADTTSVPGFNLRNLQASEDCTAIVDEFTMASLGTGAQTITPSLHQQLVTSFAPSFAWDEFITPGLASQLVTSFAPTVYQEQLVTPGLATSLVTSFTPTVYQEQLITPALSSITIQAFSPTFVQEQIITPGLAASLFTSFAPTVAQGSGPQAITPALATSLVQAFSPDVKQEQFVTPALTAQLITSFAPTLSQGGATQTITPGLAASLVTAFEPSVHQEQFITPSLSTITMQAFAPTFNVEQLISPALAQSLVTAFEPTVVPDQVITPAIAQSLVSAFLPLVQLSGAPLAVAPELATSLFTAFAPTVKQEQLVSPALVQQLVQAFDPAVYVDQAITPGLATSLVQGFVPTVTAEQLITPALATSLVQAFDPTVTPEQLVSPGLATSLITAFAPVVSPPTSSVTPGLASSLVTAFEPTVYLEQLVTPALVSQPITAFNPAVFQGLGIAPDLAQTLIVAFSPTIVIEQLVTPALASQLVIAFLPTVVNAGAVVHVSISGTSGVAKGVGAGQGTYDAGNAVVVTSGIAKAVGGSPSVDIPNVNATISSTGGLTKGVGANVEVYAPTGSNDATILSTSGIAKGVGAGQGDYNVGFAVTATSGISKAVGGAVEQNSPTPNATVAGTSGVAKAVGVSNSQATFRIVAGWGMSKAVGSGGVVVRTNTGNDVLVRGIPGMSKAVGAFITVEASKPNATVNATSAAVKAVGQTSVVYATDGASALIFSTSAVSKAVGMVVLVEAQGWWFGGSGGRAHPHGGPPGKAKKPNPQPATATVGQTSPWVAEVTSGPGKAGGT